MWILESTKLYGIYLNVYAILTWQSKLVFHMQSWSKFLILTDVLATRIHIQVQVGLVAYVYVLEFFSRPQFYYSTAKK